MNVTAQYIQNVIHQMGYSYKVIEFSKPTKTAEDAANRVQCTIGQIVKSLVFRVKLSDVGILVLTSGSNRVDLTKIELSVGEAIERADPNFVREKSGYSIGGIPPFGLKNNFLKFMDEDLLVFETVWVAAGTPYSVVEVKTKDLISMTNAKIMDIKEDNKD